MGCEISGLAYHIVRAIAQHRGKTESSHSAHSARAGYIGYIMALRCAWSGARTFASRANIVRRAKGVPLSKREPRESQGTLAATHAGLAVEVGRVRLCAR